MLKENRGVTLVALVVTIIVLLILAGVSIAMITGEEGILTKAKSVKNSGAALVDAANLAVAQAYMNPQGTYTFDKAGFLDLVQANYDGGANEETNVTITGDTSPYTITDTRGSADDTTDDAIITVTVAEGKITGISFVQ